MGNRLLSTPHLDKNRESYRKIVSGDKKDIWGKRFDSTAIVNKPSVQIYFVDVIKNLVKEDDKVLDFGCGPGSFMIAMAPHCESVTGIDVVDSFVDQAQDAIATTETLNARALYTPDGTLPFDDGEFDVLFAVDVIHHLDNIDQTLAEAFRVLKPGGRFIVFEPNKLNPLLALLHLIDPNEHGLLRLGTPRIYRLLLSKFGTVERAEFNGLVVGPDSKIFDWIASFLSRGIGHLLFRFLNPKILITGLRNGY